MGTLENDISQIWASPALTISFSARSALSCPDDLSNRHWLAIRFYLTQCFLPQGMHSARSANENREVERYPSEEARLR